MLGILSLGVCIACISCLCCLCTATVIAVPELIDLHSGSILYGNKQQHDGPKRKSDHAYCPCEKKVSLVLTKDTSEESESETCPCAMTWELVSLLENSERDCGNITKTRKYCKCPSFSQLVGNAPFPSKRLPRS